MKATLVLFVIVFASVSLVRGQACGGSTYTVGLYVQNGSHAKNARFRVFPVKRLGDKMDDAFQKYLAEAFLYGDPSQALSQVRSHPAPRVDSSRAEAFIRDFEPDKYETPTGKRPHGANQLYGTLDRGEAVFYTLETDSTPYLVEISADGYVPVYLLAAIMGGCRQYEYVILQKRT